MRSPDAREAAPAMAWSGFPKFETLGGGFDELNNAAPFAEQDAPDLRAIGIGLSPCEAAQARCAPVVCERSVYARLAAAGFHGEGVNGRGIFDALCAERVTFLADGRFGFSWQRVWGPWRSVVIIPALNEAGDLCDLIAWDFDAGGLAAWTGAASMLGADNVFKPHLAGPLLVHESVASWLRTGRRGVFILNARRAVPLLRLAEPLAVKREAFGRRLRQALTIPSPKIVVVANRERRAA